MRVGFYTSTFNDRPLEEVLDFAVEAGFDSVEMDVEGHIGTPDNVAAAVKESRDRSLFVSSITLVGNQLDANRAKRRKLRDLTHEYAAAADAVRVPILVIFPGRDPSISEDDNYKSFADQANALIAGRPGEIAFAIENWPGPANDYIATTPEGWRKLFVLVPDGRFGLEFDPSHLIRLGIDPYAAFEDVKHRLKILHGKDSSIDEARLQAVGYYGAGWWRYRLPGTGLLDWPHFLRLVRESGFDGTIAVEHEDFDFGWPRRDLEARKEGERKSLAFLRQALTEQTHRP
jgi:sugar phosphate isomerase/epimerase